MANSKPKRRQVEPLTSISFYSIVNHAWKMSRIREKLAEHCYAHALAKAGIYTVPPVSLDAYYEVLGVLVRNLLKLDCLPHSLMIKLGNCMIDFQERVLVFLSFLTQCLTLCNSLTKENVDACIYSLVMSPSGHIDPQKTMFKLLLDKIIDVSVYNYYMSFYCVSTQEALDELNRRHDAGEWAQLECLELRPTIHTPMSFWALMQKCEGMEEHMSIFQFVALNGPRESLEYYLSQMDHSAKAEELCKAASLFLSTSAYKYDREIILFFYEHMDPAHWQKLLGGHFLTIFNEMFISRRYRHMCVVFYSQAVHAMEFHLVKRVLQYLCEALSYDYFYPSMSSCYFKLDVEDLVPMFLSMWRITPLHCRQMIAADEVLYLILNKFIQYNLFHLVAAIINDPALSARKYILVSCVVSKLNVSMKKDKVSSFLKILEDYKDS